jgi:hypothetical protein
MKKYLFLLALFLIPLSNANARITVKYYLDNKEGASVEATITEAMVTGLGAGIQSANAMLTARKQPPLYCPPKSLAINYKNIVGIIDNELKRHNLSDIQNQPLGAFMVMGYMSTFPCK